MRAMLTAHPRRRAAVVAVAGLVVTATWAVAGVAALDQGVADLRRIDRGEVRTVALDAGEHVVYAEHGVDRRGYGVSYDWSPDAAGWLSLAGSTALEVVGPTGEPVPVRPYGGQLSYRLDGRHGVATGLVRVERPGDYRVRVTGPAPPGAVPAEPSRLGDPAPAPATPRPSPPADAPPAGVESRTLDPADLGPAAAGTVAIGGDVAPVVLVMVAGTAVALLLALVLAGALAARGALRRAGAEPVGNDAPATAPAPRRPESLPETASRPRAQPLAMWLTAAAVAAWLARVALDVASDGMVLAEVFQGVPTAVTQLVVPTTGVWLVTRRQVPHVPLGLAVIATWGAVVHLPPLVGAVAFQPPMRFLVPSALAVAALVAALLALRARWDRYALAAGTLRRTAAAAIGGWGLALVGGFLLHVPGWRLLPPELWGPAPFPVLAGPLLALAVLLVVAAVVWRRASLTAVPAVLVVTASAWTTVLIHVLGLVPLVRPAAPGPTSPQTGWWVAVLVEVGAAALLTVAAARLTRASRA